MKTFINILTLLLVNIALCSSSWAILLQNELKTHLRWTIEADNGLVQIYKKNREVRLETFDETIYQTLKNDLNGIKRNESYHSNIEFQESPMRGKPYRIIVSFPNDGIELFNFYKKDNQMHILDYWINTDVITTKAAALKEVPKKLLVKAKPKKNIKKAASSKKIIKKKFSDFLNIDKSQKNASRRDFRYGSALIWDYDPLIPEIEKIVDLSIKAPNYFYKVEDREILTDKKEAHMQLTINFYNKEQWGLMTRSILLYRDEYGHDKNRSLNDFMSAVSIIKNSIKPQLNPSFSQDEENKVTYSKKGILSSAYSLLNKVLENTEDIQMKTAVARYLIQQSLDSKDYIKALSYAKKLYILGTEDFDDDSIIYSSKVILHSLAQLSQLERIEEFLQNKAVSRVLSPQDGIAFKSYVKLQRNDYRALIDLFEKNKSSLVRPINAAIIFNVGEAYFRQSQLESSAALMSEYIAQYSETSYAGNARSRLALCYDLLNKPYKQTEKLYKNAINNNADLKTSIEAKIRYVGFSVTREKKITDEIKELMVFLNLVPRERTVLDSKLKEILWLTRLRTLIVSERYSDAMAYISTLPLDTMNRKTKKLFEADGAEAILGIMQEKYNKDQHAALVKTWSIYKEKYANYLSDNKYLTYVVGESYLKLGLDKSYIKTLNKLKSIDPKISRSYPIWVNIKKNIRISDLILELELKRHLIEKDYTKLDQFLVKNKNNKNINYNFYKGIVSFEKRDYNNSVKNFEQLLSSSNPNNKLKLSDSIRMINNYLEALFQTAPASKFRKNTLAIIGDLRKSDNPALDSVIEMAEYLYIESVYSDEKSFTSLVKRAQEFTQAHPNSPKLNRVNYILGVSLVKNNAKKEGLNVLQALVDKKDVPEYLKGLARSEIATLRLNEIAL